MHSTHIADRIFGDSLRFRKWLNVVYLCCEDSFEVCSWYFMWKFNTTVEPQNMRIIFFFLVYNHFNQPFLVYIWITLFSSLLFFQQAGSMLGGALWAGCQWNHVWVSPQLLKNSFTISGLQDSNPIPSIFDSWFTPILVG